MRSRIQRTSVPVISILMLILLLMVPMAGASAGQPNGLQQTSVDTADITSIQDGVKIAASRPWTAQEMQAAIPYPTPTEKDLTVSYDAAAPDGEFREAGAIPGGLPEGASISEALEDDSQLLEVLSPSAVTGYSYPPPYTRFEVFTGLSNANRYTVWPYITVGKLFFRQRGTNWECSASSIGGHAIMTAGHCVHDGSNSTGGWSTNVVFVPGYRNGAAPRGQWTASWLATKTGWYASRNLRYDLGGAVLYKRNNQQISQVVGNLGFAWNQSYSLHWNLFGYPGDPPFNGELMHTCQASYAYKGPIGSGPQTKAVGCDMTPGSSGGPWVRKLAGYAGSNNYLNGVNSYGRDGYSQEMFSPHFDSSSKSLRDLVVNGTP